MKQVRRGALSIFAMSTNFRKGHEEDYGMKLTAFVPGTVLSRELKGRRSKERYLILAKPYKFNR